MNKITSIERRDEEERITYLFDSFGNMQIYYGRYSDEDDFSWAAYWAARTPSGLTAAVFSDTRIDLAWTNVDTTGDGVSIERSLDGITYAEIDTVALGVTTYSDIGLTDGTLYYYRVKSYKRAVYSSASNVAYDVTWSTFTMQSIQPGTLSQVTFTYSMYVLGDIWVDWGNGTIEALSAGQNLTKVSNYASINTTYDIRVFGALYHLKQFKISNTTCIANFAGFTKFLELEKLFWVGATSGSSGTMNALPAMLKHLTVGNVQNSVSCAIASLPATLEEIYIYHCYQMTGSLDDLPSGLTWLRLNNMSNLPSQSVNALPAGLNYLYLIIPTLTGSIDNSPAGIIDLTYIPSTNSLTGSFAGYPKCLSALISRGASITGNINDLTSTLLSINTKVQTSVTVSADQMPVWAGTVITIHNGWLTAEVDLFLNTWQATCGTGVKTIDLAGSGAGEGNQARSAASDAAVTDMQTNHSKTFVFTP